MKPFACNYCEYSSNYKHDLKRHLKRHINQPHMNQQIPEQVSEHQSISSGGYPVQALNLSNNINIPKCPPNQVINIEAPTSQPYLPQHHSPHQPIKKIPTIHNDEHEYFDLRLKENFKLFITGPSRSGKTTFIQKLIRNLDIITKAPPKILTVVYKVNQNIYNEMNVDHLVKDGPNLKERLFEIAQGRSMLVVFDDMMNSNSLGELSDLFTVDGRHHNLSMVFISQSLFTNNEDFRRISRNCDYYALFKNPRNVQEIRTLSSQMTPGSMDLITYFMEATQNPFSYLFINLTQECKLQVKFISHLFNEPHIVKTYLDGRKKELTDGLIQGRTNFSKMFFKNQHKIIKPPKPPLSTTNSIDLGPPPPPDPPSQSDADFELETRERLRRLRDHDWVRVQDDDEWDEREDERILNELNRKNISTQTDSPVSNHVSTQSYTPVGNHISTQSNPPVGNHVSTQSDHPIRYVKSIQTDPSVRYDTSTETTPLSTNNISTQTESGIRNSTSTQTAALPSNTPTIAYNSLPALTQQDNPLQPIVRSRRPQRDWILNPSIQDMIRRPSRLRMNTPHPLPYNNYLALEDEPMHAVVPYRGVVDTNTSPVPYGNYTNYSNIVQCVVCEEEFHSQRAFNTHNCRPTVYACNLCGKNNPTRSALNQHLRTMHETLKQRKHGRDDDDDEGYRSMKHKRGGSKFT